MTKKEKAIVTAYTGFLIGEFDDFHNYAEELMGRPVFTHEFGTGKTRDTIKEKAKKDFIEL